MKKIALLLLTTVLLSGCVSKYKALTVEPPATKLSTQSKVFVMLPADGQYNGKLYPGSGTATGQALTNALALRTSKAKLGEATWDLSKSLKVAEQGGYDYLIQTTILNWEDRATEWSGIPDKLALRYVVYNVANGEEVASTTSKASSKWATFGGDHPQDLLPVPTQEFVNSLF